MKIKKLFACVLALGLLTACADDKAKEEKQATSINTEEAQNVESTNEKEDDLDKTKEEDNKELSIDDEWVVDGLAKLKINSVKQFDERNEHADFDPAQGILIDYTYENLGYRVNDADLFFEPNSVIDGEGTMGEIYPASFDISYAQDVPIGAKVENAQVTYGLKHESNEVKIMFSLYDVNNEEHRVTFKVPVEK